MGCIPCHPGVAQKRSGIVGIVNRLKVSLSPREGPKLQFKVLFLGSMAIQVPFDSLMY